MKAKRGLKTGLLILSVIYLCACGKSGDVGVIGGADGPTSILVGENTQSSMEEVPLSLKTYTPAEGLVKVLGRAAFVEDTLWMVHSGSGAEFSFVGTKATITMQCDSTIMGNRDSQARIAVFVNGECVVDDMIDKMGEVLGKKYFWTGKRTVGKEQVVFNIMKLGFSKECWLNFKKACDDRSKYGKI